MAATRKRGWYSYLFKKPKKASSKKISSIKVMRPFNKASFKASEPEDPHRKMKSPYKMKPIVPQNRIIENLRNSTRKLKKKISLKKNFSNFNLLLSDEDNTFKKNVKKYLDKNCYKQFNKNFTEEQLKFTPEWPDVDEFAPFSNARLSDFNKNSNKNLHGTTNYFEPYIRQSSNSKKGNAKVSEFEVEAMTRGPMTTEEIKNLELDGGTRRTKRRGTRRR